MCELTCLILLQPLLHKQYEMACMTMAQSFAGRVAASFCVQAVPPPGQNNPNKKEASIYKFVASAFVVCGRVIPPGNLGVDGPNWKSARKYPFGSADIREARTLGSCRCGARWRRPQEWHGPSLVPSAKLIDVPTSISSTVLSGHTELGPHPCPALAPGRCPGQRLLQLLLACPAAWLVPGKRLGQVSWVLWDSGLESDSKWRVGGCWRRDGPRIKRVLWDFHFCLGWMLPGTKAGTLQPFRGLLWNLFFLLLHSSSLSFIQFGNLQAAFCQHWSHWHKAQRCLKISRVGSKQYILIQECPAQKVWAEKKRIVS